MEASPFTRHLSEYLSEDGYKDLQAGLGANPELGDLTAQQKKALKTAIETELSARAAKRRARPV